MRTQCFLTALTLLAFSASVQAQNLLSNGNFDTDLRLSGWTGPGVLTWSKIDADDSPSSGSVRIPEGGEFGFGFSQCVSPEPAGTNVAEFSYFVPADVTVVFDSGIVMFFVWFDGPDCTGATLGGSQLLETFTLQNQWSTVRGLITPPPGADSGRVDLLVLGSGTSDFVAHFDNVFLGDRIFSDSFESPAP